jgi:hypothetical protein
MKTGCPICSGYKVVKSNYLAVTHPKLAAEWNFQKNGELNPSDVHAGSHKKVWWKCDVAEDHQWKSQIRSRVQYNLGCSFCSGRRVTKSNSLAIKRPDIAEFWHPIKNLELTSDKVTPYSRKMTWWKCPKGSDHEWQATVANVVNGSTCPVCMNRKITESNNLFALYPHLKEEWDYEQNKGINPYKIAAGSKIKVWWICKRDSEHIWYATIHDRTSKESGCPYCSKKLNMSELKMLGLIKEIFPKEKILYNTRPRWLKRMQIDVYLPKLKIGFEYQGQQHFMPVELFGGKEAFIKQVQRDKLKKEICQKRNINLLYVYFDEQLNRHLIWQKINDAGIKVKQEI